MDAYIDSTQEHFSLVQNTRKNHSNVITLVYNLTKLVHTHKSMLKNNSTTILYDTILCSWCHVNYKLTTILKMHHQRSISSNYLKILKFS